MKQRSTYHVDSVWLAVFLFGLYWYASSFFLTKHSLHHRSSCDEAPTLLRLIGLSAESILELQQRRALSKNDVVTRDGCWLDRRVESILILIVDALRVDFVKQLPKSIGSRINFHNQNHSALFRFVADPPTVTAQRIKAFTGGGLPTFAEISNNFGGATMDDDNWLSQVHSSNYQSRALIRQSLLGFVGDDTWLDLYKTILDPAYSFPYPSFNTRDFDTVDKGCIKHLPDLLDNLRPAGDLEVAIVHFLGIDHVGHTYGPGNAFMDSKLAEIDTVLQSALSMLDNMVDECRAAFIFGDHGMTDEGSHGGGTMEEISAGLFVHVSPACGSLSPGLANEYNNALLGGYSRIPSIHQIDFVPTLSFMLGIPTPFANLGSIIPRLIPAWNVHDRAWLQTTTALALNAGQVWRYLDTYSSQFHTLPGLQNLRTSLDIASAAFEKSVSEANMDNDTLEQVSVLFKHFLVQALELGHRAWTRFDIQGMMCGVIILIVSLAGFMQISLSTDSLLQSILREPKLSWNDHILEMKTSVLFSFYQCVLLTFGNSYITEEPKSLQYSLSVLAVCLALRLHTSRQFAFSNGHRGEGSYSSIAWLYAMAIPICSRIHELFISGHGLDPSIRIHSSHASPIFLTSLLVLGLFRWMICQQRFVESRFHAILDCLSFIFLGVSWLDKRSADVTRTGFLACQLTFLIMLIGFAVIISQAIISSNRSLTPSKKQISSSNAARLGQMESVLLCKVLLLIATVTGPSSASTLLLYAIQLSSLHALSRYIHAYVMAVLLKLVVRHVFFATNHGCSFSRLQYSSAFVATAEFHFVMGGISLFLNTFGWEISGLIFCLSLQRRRVFNIYVCLQLIEALSNCISVGILRRHPMMLDICAPHFLFTSIFTVITCFTYVTVSLLKPGLRV